MSLTKRKPKTRGGDVAIAPQEQPPQTVNYGPNPGNYPCARCWRSGINTRATTFAGIPKEAMCPAHYQQWAAGR